MNNTLIKTIGNLINAISYPLPHYAAKQAVKIFSTPRKGKLNDEETAYLKTAIQKTITYQTIPLKTYH